MRPLNALRNALLIATLLSMGLLLTVDRTATAQEGEANATVAAAPAPAAAQETKATPAESDSASADAAPEQKSFLRFVYDAEGIFFFPQMAISIVLLSFIVEGMFEFRRKHFVPIKFIDTVVELVNSKKYKDAFSTAKAEPALVGAMLTGGMENINRGLADAQTVIDDIVIERTLKYEMRLSWLALIANVATMIGLLGTVWGMVAAFMVIAQSETAPKPSELAAGVSQALVTTVFGLLQAIPAVFFNTLFKNSMSKFLIEADLVCKRILTQLEPVVRKSA